MWLIALTSLVLWALMLEKFYYTKRVAKNDIRDLAKNFIAHKAPYPMSKFMRSALLAEQRRRSFAGMELIKALVAITPFLGLLGTITGMIEVFDVLSLTGASNARAMASGVSKATLPTGAGMVVALSGLYFVNLLERQAEKNMHECKTQLQDETYA